MTIAQLERRVRSAGSEFVLACGMRFAAQESAVFAQFESAFGWIPGGGATQYLARILARARALEVLLSADDYDAELAERYGLDESSLPARTLSTSSMLSPGGSSAFPAAGRVAIKDRVNAITPAPVRHFRRDSDVFGDGVRTAETQSLIQTAMPRGLQTARAELQLAGIPGDLSDELTPSPRQR